MNEHEGGWLAISRTLEGSLIWLANPIGAAGVQRAP